MHEAFAKATVDFGKQLGIVGDAARTSIGEVTPSHRDVEDDAGGAGSLLEDTRSSSIASTIRLVSAPR